MSLYGAKLIGVSGKKGSGKDTVGAYLVENYGFERMAFADPLKEACCQLFGFDDEQLYGDKKETPDPRWGDVTPRKVLQLVGTELLQTQLNRLIPELGGNIFSKRLELGLPDLDKYPIVITDVRFDDEVPIIKRNGGFIIEVVRPSQEREGDPSLSSHSSEKGLSPKNIDLVIENTGSLSHLYSKIDALFTS